MQQKRIIAGSLLLFSLGFTALHSQTVKDIDGNVYKTVKIGTQTWMAENLKTTKFNDGKVILLVTDTTWHSIVTPGYCWYDNMTIYKNSYGAMYNWWAVKSGKLCPSGWHVPSDEEWTSLITFSGGENTAGGKLKETGTAHWKSPNTDATNESKFTALPGGSRFDSDGSYYGMGDYGNWWSSTEFDSFSPGSAFISMMDYRTAEISKGFPKKQSGASVRCLLGSAEITTINKSPGENTTPYALAQNNVHQQVTKQMLPQIPVTLRNEAYSFEVTSPGSWSFSKIVQQDPYEEMKSGSYSSSLSAGDEDKVPENWNGFRLNSTDASNDPQPFLIIYGHKVGDQKPEEFTTLFKRTLSRFSGEEVKADWAFSVGEAVGFDCTYGLGAKVRYTALYRDGIRIVFMYFFPSSNPADFDRYAPEVDKVIQSLRIKKLRGFS